MGCIRFYQLFISSQDIPVCNFTPSCSKFGMAAIKKYGVFYGGLMTFDRLQRCNGLGRKYYPIHPVTDKSYDPIERNTWQD
ncbi:MAG: membrane protein insertion efficiency factor YidD [Actinobacteria bacterium]|nr:membrane protein insertion efficiency factor YidD [Actinomycetota bacterium]